MTKVTSPDAHVDKETNPMPMSDAWETELADFLTHLSSVQSEVLGVLDERRQRLSTSDVEGLEQLAAREQAVLDQLQGCLTQRADLLRRAAAAGLPGESLRSLHAALPGPRRSELKARLGEAEHRARMLRLHSITNWVVVQRTLLHLSQMLEMIATRGRKKATYGAVSDRPAPEPGGGALVDQTA